MSEIESYPVPRAALLFMAAVEEGRRTNEGPFRAVAPIFRIALEPQRGQLLNIGAGTAALHPILGENFTVHAFEAFLPQLATLGWLVEERAGDGAAAYRVPASFPEFDEGGARKQAQQNSSAFKSSLARRLLWLLRL